MKQQVVHEGGPEPGVQHHKPRRLAQRMESYITAAVVVAVAVLMVVLVYGVMNTGSGTPAWMH